MGKFTIFFFLAAFLPAVFGFMPTPVLPQSTRTFTRNAAMTMNSGADLIETARREGCFNTFLKACDDIGMTTDLAFQAKPLPTDRMQLENIIKYHIVKLFVPDEKVIREFRLSNKSTMQGGRIRIVVKANPTGGEQIVEFNRGEAFDQKTDIETTNGTIHGIDGVLTPQEGTVIPLK